MALWVQKVLRAFEKWFPGEGAGMSVRMLPLGLNFSSTHLGLSERHCESEEKCLA